MNGAIQLFEAAMPASSGRSTPSAPIDVARAEDVYALWKAAFEHMKVVEAADDERSLAARTLELSGDSALSAGVPCPPSVQVGAPSAAAYVRAAPIVSAATATPGASGSAANANARHTVAASPSPVEQLPMSMRRGTSAPASRRDIQLASIATPMQPVATEAISVFVHGLAVAVVIRDCALSAQEALHCAFETARELTGRRAALEHLTLNGQTVYSHTGSGAHDPLRGPEQPASTLVLAC
jgi:hypothetical protein